MTAHIEVVAPRLGQIEDTPLTDIDIPEDRARAFDPAWAEALGSMVARRGLINPITVRIVEGRKRLVTGMHRYAAFQLKGWMTIPTRVSLAMSDDEARLDEVMENLGRHELKVLDRCHHLYEMKQVYERLHPEAVHGGARKSEIKSQRLALEMGLPVEGEKAEVFGFARQTAEKVGLSQSAIKLAVKIWKDLSVASRQRCGGTWLADHQAGLKQLSEQTPATQKSVLDILFAEPPRVTNVPDALTIITNGRVLTHDEKKLASAKKALSALPEATLATVVASNQIDQRIADLQKSIATMSKFFSELKDDELDTVISENEERIIASLKRRGRI
ncbi:chromosome partitioning protein ParB [Rhizobium sp. Root708]|uniref:ParB N-terminal domain-containing protein n=1 Tax=Rhizobium sp. Root708 TaxID=1736592 RepID=UPI0007012D7A|nr:ParB N-terminal domain-containing protein [Rhizobium sp. Root708]KRB58490.1 chromosome partitioning protein ParB [Rhizobium sp. Root708]